jgi:N-acetylglucosamine-6-phosphate deacetylase
MSEPRHVDLQVNGYAGVDFNADALTADDLHRACARLEADGVEAFLAAVITAPLDVLARRLTRLAELREQDELARRLLVGLHLEGPFLNPAPGFAGAHPPDAMRAANVDDALRLLDAATGLVRIVTLAPERDRGLHVTRRLAAEGVVVAAGHTDASRDELRAGVDAGLVMFTHLGNGCPASLDRHDNVVQRVLSLAGLRWISFIADGIHVPAFALGNYLDRIGLDRAVVVTDAIAAAGLGPGRYPLAGREVEVDEAGACRYPDEPDHLAGSAATMPRMAELLETRLGLDAEAVRRLTRTNPRTILSGGEST